MSTPGIQMTALGRTAPAVSGAHSTYKRSRVKGVGLHHQFDLVASGDSTSLRT